MASTSISHWCERPSAICWTPSPGDCAGSRRGAWRGWQELKRQRLEWEKNALALAAEREQLQWQVQELTKLGFSAAEWDELQADHGRLAHAANLIETAEFALEVLSEGEGAALATVNGVV
jgi:DNA repair protein RecN (Recombination protein N)